MRQARGGLSGSSVRSIRDPVAVFVRDIHRAQILDLELSPAIERPTNSRTARIPQLTP
jgi:hypothetical protein